MGWMMNTTESLPGNALTALSLIGLQCTTAIDYLWKKLDFLDYPEGEDIIIEQVQRCGMSQIITCIFSMYSIEFNYTHEEENERGDGSDSRRAWAKSNSRNKKGFG